MKTMQSYCDPNVTRRGGQLKTKHEKQDIWLKKGKL